MVDLEISNGRFFAGYPAAGLDSKNLEERLSSLFALDQSIPAELFIDRLSLFLSDKDLSDLWIEIDELKRRTVTAEAELEKQMERKKSLEEAMAEKDEELQLLLANLAIGQLRGESVSDRIIEELGRIIAIQPTDSA